MEENTLSKSELEELVELRTKMEILKRYVYQNEFFSKKDFCIIGGFESKNESAAMLQH